MKQHYEIHIYEAGYAM